MSSCAHPSPHNRRCHRHLPFDQTNAPPPPNEASLIGPLVGPPWASENVRNRSNRPLTAVITTIPPRAETVIFSSLLSAKSESVDAGHPDDRKSSHASVCATLGRTLALPRNRQCGVCYAVQRLRVLEPNAPV